LSGWIYNYSQDKKRDGEIAQLKKMYKESIAKNDRLDVEFRLLKAKHASLEELYAKDKNPAVTPPIKEATKEGGLEATVNNSSNNVSGAVAPTNLTSSVSGTNAVPNVDYALPAIPLPSQIGNSSTNAVTVGSMESNAPGLNPIANVPQIPTSPVSSTQRAEKPNPLGLKYRDTKGTPVNYGVTESSIEEPGTGMRYPLSSVKGQRIYLQMTRLENAMASAANTPKISGKRGRNIVDVINNDWGKYRAEAVREGSRDSKENIRKAGKDLKEAGKDAYAAVTLCIGNKRYANTPVTADDLKPKIPMKKAEKGAVNLWKHRLQGPFDPQEWNEVYKGRDPLSGTVTWASRILWGAGHNVTYNFVNGLGAGMINNLVEPGMRATAETVDAGKQGVQAIGNLPRPLLGTNEDINCLWDWAAVVPSHLANHYITGKGIWHQENPWQTIYSGGVFWPTIETGAELLGIGRGFYNMTKKPVKNGSEWNQDGGFNGGNLGRKAWNNGTGFNGK